MQTVSQKYRVANQEMNNENSLWMEYYPKLQRYCRFLAQNPWDGDDLAQQTYVKALRYNHLTQTVSPALLNKIAYHHWIDLLRKRKKETLEEAPDTQYEQPVEQIAESVEILLCQVTPKQAVTFFLKEAFQYQAKEIAAILGSSEMAVKANLHRAKKRLEKSKEDDSSFAVDPYWDEDEHRVIADLMNQSLHEQDPTVLIQSIPTFKSVLDLPILMPRSITPTQTYSPLSTLFIAA